MQIPVTFSTSIERFIQTVSGRNLSNHTAVAYHTDIRQFVSFVIETDVTVDSPSRINRTHILDCLSQLSSLGRSGVTRARKLASIREYCQFLVDEGTLPSSPAEKITGPKESESSGCFSGWMNICAS